MTLQPPPPFFGLWGLIFAGEALFVLSQAAPDWAADDMLNASGLFHAAALLSTNLWGAIFQARKRRRSFSARRPCSRLGVREHSGGCC